MLKPYPKAKPRKRKNYSSLTGTTWSKPTVYRGVTYRSTWEVGVAKLLLYSGIEFKYEPRRFVLGPKLTYLPDFYLPDLKCYLEVKGWLKDKDKLQIDMFRKKVTPRLVYIGKDELEYVMGIPGAKISKINWDSYVPTAGEIKRFQQTIHTTLRGIK